MNKIEEHPLVSIVIPAYNAELYLEDCLKSISLQTYDNFEVNIIDDGSTDKTKEIAMKYLTKDKRFHYFYQMNQGLSVSRNNGVELSHGKYVLFLDSDDLLNENCLTIISSQIEKHNAEVCIFGAEICWIEDNYRIIKRGVNKLGMNNPQNVQVIVELLKKGLFNYAWNKLYRREKLKNIKFKKGTEPAEDFIFNCRYFSECSTILLIDDVLYSYIKHGTDSLVERYFPNLENVYEEKKNAWKILVEKIEMDSALAESLEVEREFYEKESYVLNLLKSEIKDAEKIEKINSYVLDTTCRAKYNKIQNIGIFEKIFKQLCYLNSPQVMLQSYKIMTFLKFRFYRVHRKIRKWSNLYLSKE